MFLPLQQKDVASAEDRFAKDDDYGVLFTNGNQLTELELPNQSELTDGNSLADADVKTIRRRAGVQP
jgi:hypothetical protein